MKLSVILLLITLTLPAVCQQSALNEYSAVAMQNVQSPQGSLVFKVYSQGKSAADARKRAQRDAVHAVIFQGISGTRYSKPLIADPAELTENKAYWKKFFGLKDLVKGKINKRVNPMYLNYVKVPTNYTIDPKDKKDIGNGKKSVGIVVEVAYDNLREKLIQDKKVEKFGF